MCRIRAGRTGQLSGRQWQSAGGSHQREVSSHRPRQLGHRMCPVRTKLTEKQGGHVCCFRSHLPGVYTNIAMYIDWIAETLY